MRESPFRVIAEPGWFRIVRNFSSSNCNPCCPTRICRNRTGPEEVHFIARAMTANKGNAVNSARDPNAKSKHRLAEETAHGLTSRPLRTGSSPAGTAIGEDRIISWLPRECGFDFSKQLAPRFPLHAASLRAKDPDKSAKRSTGCRRPPH